MSSLTKGTLKLMNRTSKLNENQRVKQIARALVSGQFSEEMDRRKGLIKMKRWELAAMCLLNAVVGYVTRWLWW